MFCLYVCVLPTIYAAKEERSDRANLYIRETFYIYCENISLYRLSKEKRVGGSALKYRLSLVHFISLILPFRFSCRVSIKLLQQWWNVPIE